MSNEYINGVIAHSQSKRSARAVLIAIANRAQPDGTSRPGLATIADEAGVSERTATRAIKQLVEMGELEISEPSHQHFSPQYRILLQPEKRAQSRQHVTSGKIQGSQIDARGDNLSSRGDKLTEDYYTRDLNPVEPKENPEGTRATLPARKVVSHKSPYLDKTHFVDGYIPPGKGANAVEVYYERFSINQDIARLNALKEDDLIRQCPDLDRLRAVVTEYSQTTYKPGNVRLILDWYRDGPPSQRKTNASSAFGLQRNGTHNATSIKPDSTNDEQPDPEFLAEFIAANRKIDAATEAARRRL